MGCTASVLDHDQQQEWARNHAAFLAEREAAQAKAAQCPEESRQSSKLLDGDVVDDEIIDPADYSEGNETEDALYEGSLYDDGSEMDDSAILVSTTPRLEEVSKTPSPMPEDHDNGCDNDNDEETKMDKLNSAMQEPLENTKDSRVATSSGDTALGSQNVRATPKTLNTSGLLDENSALNGIRGASSSGDTRPKIPQTIDTATANKNLVAVQQQQQTSAPPESPDKKKLKDEIARLREEIQKLERMSVTVPRAPPPCYAKPSQLVTVVPVVTAASNSNSNSNSNNNDDKKGHKVDKTAAATSLMHNDHSESMTAVSDDGVNVPMQDDDEEESKADAFEDGKIREAKWALESGMGETNRGEVLIRDTQADVSDPRSDRGQECFVVHDAGLEKVGDGDNHHTNDESPRFAVPNDKRDSSRSIVSADSSRASLDRSILLQYSVSSSRDGLNNSADDLTVLFGADLSGSADQIDGLPKEIKKRRHMRKMWKDTSLKSNETTSPDALTHDTAAVSATEFGAFEGDRDGDSSRRLHDTDASAGVAEVADDGVSVSLSIETGAWILEKVIPVKEFGPDDDDGVQTNALTDEDGDITTTEAARSPQQELETSGTGMNSLGHGSLNYSANTMYSLEDSEPHASDGEGSAKAGSADVREKQHAPTESPTKVGDDDREEIELAIPAFTLKQGTSVEANVQPKAEKASIPSGAQKGLPLRPGQYLVKSNIETSVCAAPTRDRLDDRPKSFSLVLLDHSDKNNESSPQHASEINDSTKQHKKSDVKSFFDLLNLDPWSKDSILDDERLLQIIVEHPKYCKTKYAFEGFNGSIYPLSALCALGASVMTIKKCYNAYPDAIEEADAWVGTSLHYACSYQAPFEVVEYLAKKNPYALKAVNQFKRLPLHMACMFGADTDVVSYLIRKYSGAAKRTDKEGMTPLHIICDSDGGVDSPIVSGQMEQIVELLIEANPEACKKQSNDGATPLLLAVARNAPLPVLKALIVANQDPLSIADKGGRLCLHVAVAVNATAATFKLLVESYPGGLLIENKDSEIPHAFAAKMKLDTDKLELLKPN